MNFKTIAVCILSSLLWACEPGTESEISKAGTDSEFVRVEGKQFKLGTQSYYFLGTNFWYAMNLGSTGKGGDRERLIRELDRLKELGITNLRIMGMTEGPDSEPYRIVPALQKPDGTFDEELLKGLDFALAEIAKRDLKAVICLSNFWAWSGGFPQYVQWATNADSIPYPPPHPNGSFDTYQNYTASIYSLPKAVDRYKKAVEHVVKRKNTITNIAYADDPAIMAWELCNEPRGVNNVKAYLKWIDSSSTYIKSLDNNHLVTVGSEGETGSPETSGCDFELTHQFKNIDYTTVHIWIQNWNWYDPAKHEDTYPAAREKALDYLNRHLVLAKKMNKPFVLEEFGIMKDNGSFEPSASNTHRNEFYKAMLEEIYRHAKDSGDASGINFWAWGGEGRPKKAQGWWKPGDNFIGDPPHEEQGWYSVYETDTSTLQLLKTYGNKFSELSSKKGE